MNLFSVASLIKAFSFVRKFCRLARIFLRLFLVTSTSSISPKSSSIGSYEFYLLKVFCLVKSSFSVTNLATLMFYCSIFFYSASYASLSANIFFSPIVFAWISLMSNEQSSNLTYFLMRFVKLASSCSVFSILSFRSLMYLYSRSVTKSCSELTTG